MDRLDYQMINLETLRAQVQGYSRALHPVLLAQVKNERSELDMLQSVYQRLQSLHACMASDLVELEIRLALSSQPGSSRACVDVQCLSCKENEVLNMFAKGYSYGEVAGLLGCKLTTIQTHAKRIYKKLRVHSRAEAVFEARQLGLVRS